MDASRSGRGAQSPPRTSIEAWMWRERPLLCAAVNARRSPYHEKSRQATPPPTLARKLPSPSQSGRAWLCMELTMTTREIHLAKTHPARVAVGSDVAGRRLRRRGRPRDEKMRPPETLLLLKICAMAALRLQRREQDLVRYHLRPIRQFQRARDAPRVRPPLLLLLRWADQFCRKRESEGPPRPRPPPCGRPQTQPAPASDIKRGK